MSRYTHEQITQISDTIRQNRGGILFIDTDDDMFAAAYNCTPVNTDTDDIVYLDDRAVLAFRNVYIDSPSSE
jgi:hypothetical protein